MVGMYRKEPCIRVNGDIYEEVFHEVIDEIPLALFVNGRHIMTAMVSPVDLRDYVTGYLFTEQVIRGTDEIESMKVEENRISVITKNPFKHIGPKKTILSGCGGSVSYIDTEKLPMIDSPLSVSISVISDIAREAMDSELYRLTGGVHIVALADHEGIIAVSEDIGRYNALDRVIGYSMRNGISLSLTFAIVSGRISSEMVRKCLYANIPLIVSQGATTTLAIDVARRRGLTIVVFSRDLTMNIYTNPDRIILSG